MKVTISRDYYQDRVTMEHGSDDLSVSQVIEILVRPALLAMGYMPESLEDVIGPVDDDAISVTVDDDEW